MSDSNNPLLAALAMPQGIVPAQQLPPDAPPPDVGQPPPDQGNMSAAAQGGSLTPQPILKPPTATTGYGMPALITMIGQMIHPTATLQPGQMPRAPSRASEFESFLANFASSLAQGMAASGHGPGSNMRGAAAAINAPHQAALQQYGLQQQAQEQQARIATQQAQTQQSQAETQAIPQRLENEHQIAIANLGLRQAQEQFNNLYKQQMLNLNAGKFDLAKQRESFNEANKTWETQLRAKHDQAMAGNIQSQIQYRADSMAERRYMDSQVTQLRQQANQLRQQGLTQQADSIDIQADNTVNRIGLMATLESDIGLRKVVTPNMPAVPRNNVPAPSNVIRYDSKGNRIQGAQ